MHGGWNAYTSDDGEFGIPILLRTMWRLTFIIMFLTILALAWWSWSQGHALPAVAAAREPVVIPFSQGKSWVDELRNGSEVVFTDRSPVEPGRQPEANLAIKSLGPLPVDMNSELKARIDLAGQAESLARAATKAESGDPILYLEFLRERFVYEKVLVALAQVDTGDYVVLPQNSPLPPIPDDFGVLACIGAAILGGKSVDAWFFVDLGKNSAAAGALRQAEEFEAYQVSEDVLAFNALDIGIRRQRIEASDQASRELRNWPTNRPAEEAVQLRARQLPSSFAVDRVDWRVRARVPRRH